MGGDPQKFKNYFQLILSPFQAIWNNFYFQLRQQLYTGQCLSVGRLVGRSVGLSPTSFKVQQYSKNSVLTFCMIVQSSLVQYSSPQFQSKSLVQNSSPIFSYEILIQNSSQNSIQEYVNTMHRILCISSCDTSSICDIICNVLVHLRF